jgi:DNA replication and repair protein RecF
MELDEGFNILQGENAQGKTNFLEALYAAATTRLLRGMRDYEAIMEGETSARIEVELLDTGTLIGLNYVRGGRKRAVLNGMSLPRASDVIGRLPCVCSSLADMPIVAGEPSERRLFVDLELSQLEAAYLHHFALYKRSLEQRNALLRSSQEVFQPPESFEPWERPIAEHGAALRAIRTRFIGDLSPLATDIHSFLANGETLAIRYAPRDAAMTADELYDALVSHRNSDIARGSTTVGPHRDDVSIEVGGREARIFGSQGQQRTVILALRMATLQLGSRMLGSPPMLLLDDILADLDEGRRARLVDWVSLHAGQAILTCTEIESIGDAILGKATVFRVKEGSMAKV